MHFYPFLSSDKTQIQDKEYVLPNCETASFISDLIFAVYKTLLSWGLQFILNQSFSIWRTTDCQIEGL